MKRIVLTLVIALISIKSFGQKENTSLIDKITLQVIDNEYLLFDLIIANDTLTFYFDTGAATSLIDTNSAKRLGIKPNHEQNIQGAGGTKTYRVATGQKLSINTIELDNVNLVFEDLTRLKKALKVPFDGIIGYSLINAYITEIDYLQKEIRLYSDTSNFNLSEHSEHSFSFSNGIPIPQFEIEIVLNNNEVLKGEIFFKGSNIIDLEPEERSHLGIFLAFQYPIEIPGVSNEDFLRLAYNSKQKVYDRPTVDPIEFLGLINQKLKLVNMSPKFLSRNINEGFSGGEKKRNEILQMILLDSELSILDETDSGLDIDALKIISNGINNFMNENKSIILITHYQRLLDYINPTYVHVMQNGQIIKTGSAKLAQELEDKGYEWLTT